MTALALWLSWIVVAGIAYLVSRRLRAYTAEGHRISLRFDALRAEQAVIDVRVARIDDMSEDRRARLREQIEDWMRRADEVCADSQAWQARKWWRP